MTVNHYYRPNFNAWWFALATAAGLDLGDAAAAESFGGAVARHLAPEAA